jgi:hypothetical protein
MYRKTINLADRHAYSAATCHIINILLICTVRDQLLQYYFDWFIISFGIALPDNITRR